MLAQIFKQGDGLTETKFSIVGYQDIGPRARKGVVIRTLAVVLSYFISGTFGSGQFKEDPKVLKSLLKSSLGILQCVDMPSAFKLPCVQTNRARRDHTKGRLKEEKQNGNNKLNGYVTQNGRSSVTIQNPLAEVKRANAAMPQREI